MTSKETHEHALQLFRDGDASQAATILAALRDELIAQGDTAQAAEAENDLGVAYYRLGKMEQARIAFEQSRIKFEQTGNGAGQGRALGNLAQALRRSGEAVGAEKNYARAAELFHTAGEKEYEFDTYRALSQMQMQRGRFLESLASYDHALAAKGGSKLFRMFLRIPLKLIGAR